MNLLRLLICALTLCGISCAAAPDWPQVEAHAISLLQRYVQIRSVNPPADTRETAHLLATEFAASGLETRLYSSGPAGQTNLLVRLPGRDRSKRPLLLLNHMDVVPADPARWIVDPFAATIQDGQIWGRGTLDMKSTGVMQLVAMTLLKKLGIVPSRDILFLATCDEESGGVLGAAWMIANHWQELNPEYVLDEGGVGSRDLYSPGRLVFGVSIADKQVLWLRLRAQGTSGHGSQPIPDNANDLLMRAIEQAKAFPHASETNPVVAELKNQLTKFADNKFMNAVQQNTISVTSLRSGVGNPPKSNVIPSLAEATLDCRLLPGQNADEFISEIKARINDPRVTVETISPKPDDPPLSKTDTPLFQVISASIRKGNPQAAVLPIIVPYGTDGQKFRKRGVAAYGVIPMILDSGIVATMHSDSERIPLDQFREGLHIYFDILRSQY